MMAFDVGDRVQAHIPRADDVDHRYHGEVGEITDIFTDELSDVMGNPSRGYIYTVAFDDPALEPADFRYDDLQPPDSE